MALSVQEIEKEINALSTEDKTALLRALIAVVLDQVCDSVMSV